MARFELKMAAPDAGSLDRVSQLLRTNGWTPTSPPATWQRGNSYEGRIPVRPKGAS